MGRFVDQTVLAGYLKAVDLAKVNRQTPGEIDALLPKIESDVCAYARERYPIVNQPIALEVDDALKGIIAKIWAYQIGLRFLGYGAQNEESQSLKEEHDNAMAQLRSMALGGFSPVIRPADGSPALVDDPSLDTKTAHVFHGRSRWGRR